MRTVNLIILLSIGLLIYVCGIVKAGPKLFYTVANRKQVGSLSLMINDGHYYWFSSYWGSFFQYDPMKDVFILKKFSGSSQVEVVMSMKLIEGRVWLGLYTLGVAIYNPETNDFEYYDMDDGIAGKVVGNDRYCKITSIAYDKHTKMVWLGSVGTEITVYDTLKKKWVILDESTIKNIDVSSIAISDKYVVIAASGRRGVYYLDKSNNTWHHCGESPFNSGVIGGLNDVSVVGNKIRFLVNRQKAVVEYDIDKKQYTIVYQFGKDTVPESMTEYGDYWIFSTSKGIIFYNVKNKKTKVFNKSHGLVDYWINRVYIEGEEMWVLTQSGISKAKMADVLNELKDIQ